jgi:N-acetylglucosamine kinase-like BadF-type ATPase
MLYFIGIDGGGTKTNCVLTDEKFNIIHSAQSGASNPLSVGFENSAIVISKLIHKASKKVKPHNSLFVVAAIAGCGRKVHADKLTRLLKSEFKKSGASILNFKIISDAEAALEGALGGKTGALLIAGTGSILIGKNKSGELIKIGGYGKIIGDEGGGYSIGIKALNHISKVFDGRSAASLLAENFKKKIKVKTRDELINKVYSGELNPADLAPLVLKAAKQKDIIAQKILNEEADELLAHINAFKKITGAKELIISFSGSLLTNKNYLSDRLKEKLGKQIIAIKPKYQAEIGAAILAKKYFEPD